MAAFSQKQAKVNNMRTLYTEMICAWALALQCSQRYYDTNNMMVRELALQPASLFHGCGAKTKTRTKLFSRVIWKSNLHRVSETCKRWCIILECMWCSAVRAMTWGWNCAGLPQQLQRCGTVISGSSMSQWIHFWQLRSMAYCYLHGCHRHVFHERFICRWKTLKLRCIIILRGTFRDHIFWPASVSDEHYWWPEQVSLTGADYTRASST